MTDLEKLGLVNGNNDTEEKPENPLPEEMMDQEFLESPIGRVMQALAGLEMAAKSFNARLDQMEQYVTYLLSKDPHMGPKISAIMKVATGAKKDTEGKNE